MLREFAQTIIEAQQVLKDHIAKVECTSLLLTQSSSSIKQISMISSNSKPIYYHMSMTIE